MAGHSAREAVTERDKDMGKVNKLESIVPPLELCKRIPEGEFEDSALVYKERIGISRDYLVKMREPEDISYKVESAGVNYFPAPTLEEIRRKLRNLSIVPGDDVIHVECKIDPENWVSTIAVNENDVTAAALRLWFKVKGINLE